MMMHGPEHLGGHRWWRSPFHHRDDLPPAKPNGSKSVSILLRLSALMLALSSAIIMAASGNVCGSGDATFSYTRVDAFVLLVGCTVTAAILEALAIYLQVCLNATAAAADPDDKSIATDMEEEEEISPAGMTLVVLDHIIPALLYSGMTAAYYARSHDQDSSCSRFSTQVVQARILSLVASLVVTAAGIAKAVPLPFNLPPVRG